MGGVFDPIHFGHLFTAEEARIEFKLDKVIFVPCRQPAHKRENDISEPEREYLKKCNHGAKIFFITGADAFLEVDSWYKSEELIKLCQFVAATRPGYDLNKLDQKFKKIIKIMEIPALSISSTYIRRRVKEGRNIKYLVPHEVEKYIYKKELYRKT